LLVDELEPVLVPSISGNALVDRIGHCSRQLSEPNIDDCRHADEEDEVPRRVLDCARSDDRDGGSDDERQDVSEPIGDRRNPVRLRPGTIGMERFLTSNSRSHWASYSDGFAPT